MSAACGSCEAVSMRQRCGVVLPWFAICMAADEPPSPFPFPRPTRGGVGVPGLATAQHKKDLVYASSLWSITSLLSHPLLKGSGML